jgi:hypothetical protein
MSADVIVGITCSTRQPVDTFSKVFPTDVAALQVEIVRLDFAIHRLNITL